MPVRLESFAFSGPHPGLDDIFQNLHGQIGKTGLVKVLNQLAADGSISLKTYGKQQVFVARQDEKDLPSEEEIDRIDADIAERKGELEALQTQTKQLATSTHSFVSVFIKLMPFVQH